MWNNFFHLALLAYFCTRNIGGSVLYFGKTEKFFKLFMITDKI